ncbi:alanine racemase [Prosthecochloris sp.]|uniref:alanine racemase n=1 Tax=Prosthecochloris sp. TaxID=290513 RepID=UPI00257CC5AC|nr:alanine racemase [Prosthecochloris sp.]
MISSNNLIHNFRKIQERITDTCRIMGIVKANAYGHGALHISKTLESLGVSDFGVANITEAVHLRKQNAVSRNAAILAFCSPLPSHLPLYLQHDITATICDFDTLRTAESIASSYNMPLKVHVKIDTGMGRLGIPPEAACNLLQAVEQTPHLQLTGAYTHFAQSTKTDDFADRQIRTFTEVCSEFEHHAKRSLCKHAANSGALLCRKDACLDMVRPGIMLYGYPPDESVQNMIDLKPAMELRAKVIFIKDVETGTTISYNRQWTAPSRCKIATISAGYADGYLRTLSNRAKVFIRGNPCSQVGTITMDQTMVDLGKNSNVRVGDDAVLFGWNGLSAADLAKIAGTISYEILCAVSSRVKRVFI